MWIVRQQSVGCDRRINLGFHIRRDYPIERGTVVSSTGRRSFPGQDASDLVGERRHLRLQLFNLFQKR
ncbi:hypothetical protein D3C84_983410 [compost metagenome]